MKLICRFYGGTMHGLSLPLEVAERMTERRSEDLSDVRARGGLVHRAELDNRPEFDEYLGPMWDGMDGDCGVLRYETQDIYDMLSR